MHARAPTMDAITILLQERLAAVERCMHAACARAGRRRESVTLVAVTKTVASAVAARLPALGIFDLGENRPQALWSKAAQLPAAIRWHLIGHLQRNKVERTLPLTQLIHSVDSLRLLAALEAESAKSQRRADVLLEVNASREPNKHGFRPEEIADVLSHLHEYQALRVRGLMTMAALTDDPEAARPTFAALRELRDRLRPSITPPHTFDELSMGMSNDFEVAIEEGATLVRIGSVLFEGLSEDEG